MASKKKESEGIALLSMYGDEDDDMEEDIDTDDDNKSDNDAVPPENKEQSEVVANEAANMEEDDPEAINNSNNVSYNYGSSIDRVVSLDIANDNSTPVSNDNSTPPPLPAQQVIGVEPSRGRKGTLTIVDYGHDEAALSPEAEEGEILATGRVMFGAELQTVNGTPPGTVQLLTPTQSTPPQSSEHIDQSQSVAINHKGNESESVAPDETVNITQDGHKEMDPLGNFLPPPPTTKCSVELQDRISFFLSVKKKSGRSFNSEVRNKKEYRNPDFLLHAVTYQDIDQIGSCFSKDVFDPHGYDKRDYYDEIEADMKRELERKEQEKKKSQKIEFLSGGSQPAAAIPTQKIMPIPAVPGTTGGGSNSVSAAVDNVTREGRPNKKSKWDKVDGDRRHPVTSSGQDSLSNASLLSAANAGTGYTAFAQQRRREAEERRSSDRKLDRRS